MSKYLKLAQEFDVQKDLDFIQSIILNARRNGILNHIEEHGDSWHKDQDFTEIDSSKLRLRFFENQKKLSPTDHYGVSFLMQGVIYQDNGVLYSPINPNRDMDLFNYMTTTYPGLEILVEEMDTGYRYLVINGEKAEI